MKIYINSQIGLGWNHYWPTIITIQYEAVEFTDKFSDKTDVISKHQFDIKTKVTKNFIK